MSRIHEALEQAAQQPETAAGAPADSTGTLPSAGIDLAGAAEIFPQEPAAAPVAADAAVSVIAAPTRAASPGEEPAARRDSVFEHIDSRFAEKVVVDASMPGPSREQYRRLAAVLHDAQATRGLKVVLIASAVSGEGKTLTAANLALTLAESYKKRVLLIDGDLRKPALHQIFKIHSAVGLSDGLDPASDVKLVVYQVSSRLSVLPAGRPTSDPMAGLISARMRRLIDEAKDTFDWVIIDTPPVVLLPDANLLAAMVDGAVLVIKARSTPHALVKRAAEAIGVKRIIGSVLNQAEQPQEYGYGGYYEYYMGGPPAPRTP